MIKYCWDAFSVYADNSTVHGVKYLAEPKRPLWERICWIIAYICAIYGLTTLILDIYDKYNDTPVVVSFSDKPVQVSDIPFPAVTICPQVKASHLLLNITETVEIADSYTLTDVRFAHMRAVLQTCKFNEFQSNLRALTIGGNFIDRECTEFLQQVKPNYPFISCQWQNKDYNCNQKFTEIITDEGICYTFNMINSKDLYRDDKLQKDYIYYQHNLNTTEWTLENGYSENAPLDTYPFRVFSSNNKDSLKLVLKAKLNDINHFCSGLIEGFKIMFHSPSDNPHFSKNFHYILYDKKVYFSIKPKMMTTDDNLDSYKPDKRQCFYNKERNLRFFKVYSKSNCELECLANYTLSECGCVKFYMPNSPETELCGSEKINCCRDAEYNLIDDQRIQSIYNDNGAANNFCNCLPACTSIVYDTEITHYHFDWERTYRDLGINQSEFNLNKNVDKCSEVTIQFKSKEFTPINRSELYGLADFISNCGGLIGLFMGASILSLFEIIYFFSIRLITDWWRNKRTENIADDL